MLLKSATTSDLSIQSAIGIVLEIIEACEVRMTLFRKGCEMFHNNLNIILSEIICLGVKGQRAARSDGGYHRRSYIQE